MAVAPLSSRMLVHPHCIGHQDQVRTPRRIVQDTQSNSYSVANHMNAMMIEADPVWLRSQVAFMCKPEHTCHRTSRHGRADPSVYRFAVSSDATHPARQIVAQAATSDGRLASVTESCETTPQHTCTGTCMGTRANSKAATFTQFHDTSQRH